MEEQEFVESVFNEARQRGHRVETNRQGLPQVDFGHKKLHAEHIRRLFPAILNPQAICMGFDRKRGTGKAVR